MVGRIRVPMMIRVFRIFAGMSKEELYHQYYQNLLEIPEPIKFLKLGQCMVLS